MVWFAAPLKFLGPHGTFKSLAPPCVPPHTALRTPSHRLAYALTPPCVPPHTAPVRHRAPRFALGTAVDVLSSGTYHGLPAVLSTHATPAATSIEDDQRGLDELTRILRFRVLTGARPAALQLREAGACVLIRPQHRPGPPLTPLGCAPRFLAVDGRVKVAVAGEFEVRAQLPRPFCSAHL